MCRLLRFKGISAKIYPSSEVFLAQDNFSIPGCLVLDIGSTSLSDIDLHERLTKHIANLPTIYTGRDATIDMAVQAMKMGAVDFFAKSVSDERIINAILMVINKYLSLEPELDKFARAYDLLSTRERQVIELSVKGLSHKDVAQSLGITPKTAMVHRYNAYIKLGYHNITEIFHMMVRVGLVDDTEI